jgi:thymidylate synthase
MTLIKADSFAELYTKVMDKIYNYPDYITSPRNLKIKECINVAMELSNPLNNLFKCEDKLLTLATAYLKKEMALYLSATNDANLFSAASPFWNKIKNDDNTVNSAYGNLIFNPSLSDGRSQFDWAFDCLKADKDSRQAIVRFNTTSHQYSGVKDFPCTFLMIFHIRDNKLHATIEMRSNDICKGLAYDLPSFTLFQYLMFLKLKPIYPDLELGSYTHISNSLHIYESDFELCEKRLSTTLLENAFPMPRNWNCIRSDDINYIVKTKVVENTKTQIKDITHIKYPENIEFYNWLLS